MTTVIGGSAPSITFSDSTTQSTAALPLTGGSVSADITVHGLTVGQGGGSVSTNTAVGASALALNSTGSINTAVGANSMSTGVVTGTYNSGFGFGSLYSVTSGGANSAIGASALQYTTTGSNNTGVGTQSLYNNTTASYNTAVGSQAGSNVTTGGANTYLGYNSQASGAAVTNEIVIGSNSVGKGSSTGILYAASVYNYSNTTLWNVTSDERLKKNIVDNTVGLTAINGIKVRNFEYRLPDEITDLDKSNAVNITGVQLGPIAQELQQVLPDCVKEESTGVLSVNSSDVLWHLVTAVQQLKAEFDSYKATHP